MAIQRSMMNTAMTKSAKPYNLEWIIISHKMMTFWNAFRIAFFTEIRSFYFIVLYGIIKKCTCFFLYRINFIRFVIVSPTRITFSCILSKIFSVIRIGKEMLLLIFFRSFQKFISIGKVIFFSSFTNNIFINKVVSSRYCASLRSMFKVINSIIFFFDNLLRFIHTQKCMMNLYKCQGLYANTEI